nr:ribonuclease H-like domain-containing protein [Tanacetum cinerariifolium]
GALSCYKARLVTNGSTQLSGVDVDETFSLVVKPGNIQTVLSLAISRHWLVHQLDVKNAFLYEDLSETVYMHHHSRSWDSAYPDYKFSNTDLGSLNYFMGISITRESLGMFLSKRKYATEILERALMVSCDSSGTLVDTESQQGDDGDLVFVPTFYRILTGSLQYLTFTRPNTSYAVQQLFSSSTTSLVFYSDADWAGFPTIQRSTLAEWNFLPFLLRNSSWLMKLPSASSIVAIKYRSVANVVAETCWLRNLLRELHTPLSCATLVYCDNVSAVYLSSNPVQHQRTKHIEIDIHFVRDLVVARQICVLHVHSRYRYADVFLPV